MVKHWFERPNGTDELSQDYLITRKGDKFAIESVQDLSLDLSQEEGESAFLFLCAPISTYSQEAISSIGHTKVLNAPSCKVCSDDFPKLKRLVQIRGRGKSQDSVEIKVYILSNLNSFQPDCGRIVAKEEAEVDVFIVDTRDVFTDEKVLKVIRTADILLCRANHPIQYQAFWLAISAGAVPVLPEGPVIKSYAAQPILNGLLEQPPSRYVDEHDDFNSTINGFIASYSVLVSQLRWHYANGLTSELLQLCLDDPSLPQNGVLNK